MPRCWLSSPSACSSRPGSANDLALAIRACARHIAVLNQLRTQTKNQLHAAQQTTTTPDFLIASRHQSTAHFDAQIKYLHRQVFDLIAADEALRQSFKLLVSATGIAAASAIQLLGERLVLPDDMRAKQWSAMAGLDSRQHPSGSSVSKKPPIQGREPLLADRSLYARSQRRSL